MLICMASEKGGSGKSTLAAILAERFLALGIPVTLADSDKQASLSALAERSEGRLPPCREVFPRSFPKLAVESGLVILDTPSGAGPELRAALAVADVVVVPVVAAPYDFRTLPVTLDLIAAAQEARHGAPRALLVPNKVSLREASSRKLLELVKGLGWPVSKTHLPERSAFKRLADSGLAVLPPSSRRTVEREIQAVAEEVLEALGMTEGATQ
jgi:chromosome partitioning protein